MQAETELSSISNDDLNVALEKNFTSDQVEFMRVNTLVFTKPLQLFFVQI